MIELSKEAKSAVIAKNVAVILDEMCDGPLTVNLGIGIPLQTVQYLSNDNIFVHTENGMIGVGPLAYGDDVHPDLCNAGRQSVKETRGCAYTDAAESFGMIRGGHIDVAVLGAFEVDENATIANWIIPGGKMLGVGGAMDLVSGAKTVIVAMSHTGKDGTKLVPRCKLPITGYHVNYIVTEKCVLHFINGCWTIEKIYPNLSVEEVQKTSGFWIAVSDDLEQMEIPKLR